MTPCLAEVTCYERGKISKVQPCTPLMKQLSFSLQAYFVALGVACAMALLLLAPMANLKSYVQREAAAKRRLERKAA